MMGADMTLVALATPIDPVTGDAPDPDWEAGRRALDTVTSTGAFCYDDIESQFPGYEDLQPADKDPDGMPRLELLKQEGRRIIDACEQAIASQRTTVLLTNGYWLYLSGGLSYGDPPTEAYEAICDVDHLPAAVFDALGLVSDWTKPPASRYAGGDPYVTDADIVTALAYGLGSQPNQDSDLAVEWLSVLLAKVRPDPRDGSPADYIAQWRAVYGTDAIDDEVIRDLLNS